MDLGFKGSTYTWTNKQSTSIAIFERLDRALVTVQWSQNFTQAYVNHLPRIHSDHAPILLRTKETLRHKPNFKFENGWLVDPEFHTVCQKSWNQGQHKQFTEKMSHVRIALRS